MQLLDLPYDDTQSDSVPRGTIALSRVTSKAGPLDDGQSARRREEQLAINDNTVSVVVGSVVTGSSV